VDYLVWRLIAGLAIFVGLRFGVLNPGMGFVLFLLVWPILSLVLIAKWTARAVATDARAICGRTYFGTKVKIEWDEVGGLDETDAPTLGSTWRVRSSETGRHPEIVFTEKLRGHEELIEEIRLRTGIAATQTRSWWRELLA
jgi:membrane protein implicated in regulation of membrane protease activity